MGSQIALTMSMMMIVCMSIQLGLLARVSSGAGGSSLAEQCSNSIQEVTSCLTYATGKASEPTKECCNAVTDMRDKQPVCLCFFIGQAHNGSEQIKSLGIQESKLLTLPSACHLTNADPTNCPKLLGISPTSPAAAIFENKNGASPATSTTPSTTSSTTSSTTTPTADKSSAFNNGNSLLALFILSSFLYAISVGN